jgi:hypothetical protein
MLFTVIVCQNPGMMANCTIAAIRAAERDMKVLRTQFNVTKHTKALEPLFLWK